ncbi:hypothetical protein OESDEN_07571 [Oesophagostomum dentatum]|uniref:Zinc knuckle n=1 Tax=Oesophagostomum dentatum TaxID=61180 RepID=A0A0B1T4P4_OESDE|nr:hypothetical protein OESDEN_07571 [Oesophagostomum dentatum]
MPQVTTDSDALTMSNATRQGGNSSYVSEVAMERMDDTEIPPTQQRDTRREEVEELKVCENIRRKLKEMKIELAAEVSKHWRIGDAKRGAFEKMLESSTNDMEAMLSSLAQLCQESEEERKTMKQLMMSLRCPTRYELLGVMEELTEKAALVDAVQSHTSWPENEILEKCCRAEQKEARLLETESKIVALQRQLEAQQKEIEKLREGQKNRTVAVEEGRMEGEPLLNANHDRLEAIRSLRHVWCYNELPFQVERPTSRMSSDSTWQNSRRSTAATQNSRGRSRLNSITSDESESCVSERQGYRAQQRKWDSTQGPLDSYLKYIALPEVKVYSGRDKDYPWETFRESFALKYPKHSWSDQELKALLRAKLTDKAKAQFEALPLEVRRGSYDGIIAALSKTNRAETQTNRVVALGKLKRLKKAETVSVAEFCVELERLSASAYPELDEHALATTRAQHLYEQLVNWPESYHLLEAMEKDENNAYANLKEAAMRVERRKLTMANVKESRGEAYGGRASVGGAKFTRRQDWRIERPYKVDSTKETGSREKPPVSGNSVTTPSKEMRSRCYNCNEKGHLARDCKGPKTHKGSPRGLQSAASQLCDSTPPKNDGVATTSLYGGKSVTEVIVFRRIWDALLDTGSEISIMPESVMHQIMKDGYKLQEFAVDRNKRILDASGNRMKFSTVVEIPIREKDKGEVMVRMHVVKQPGHVIVLGSNALPSLGYELVSKKEKYRGTDPKERDCQQVCESTKAPMKADERPEFLKSPRETEFEAAKHKTHLQTCSHSKSPGYPSLNVTNSSRST